MLSCQLASKAIENVDIDVEPKRPERGEDSNFDLAFGRDSDEFGYSTYLRPFAERFVNPPAKYWLDWPRRMLLKPDRTPFAWSEIAATDYATKFRYTMSSAKFWMEEHPDVRIKFNLWGLDPYESPGHLHPDRWGREMPFQETMWKNAPKITLSEFYWLRLYYPGRIDYYYFDAGRATADTMPTLLTGNQLNTKIHNILAGISNLGGEPALYRP